MNKIFYWLMLVGFIGCGVSAPDVKTKIIGILLAVVNAIIFWG